MFYSSLLVLVVVVDLPVSRLPSLTGEEQRSHHDLIIYATVLAISIFLVICTTLCLRLVPMNASYTIHNKMVSSIIEAPLSFHVINPVSRIMNLFSQDINNLDELLPDNFTLFCLFFTRALAALVLASIANVILIPLGLVTLLFPFFTSRFYLHTALDLKRLMSVAGGPLYSHFSNTIEGLRTIRVYKQQWKFMDKVYG